MHRLIQVIPELLATELLNGDLQAGSRTVRRVSAAEMLSYVRAPWTLGRVDDDPWARDADPVETGEQESLLVRALVARARMRTRTRTDTRGRPGGSEEGPARVSNEA